MDAGLCVAGMRICDACLAAAVRTACVGKKYFTLSRYAGKLLIVGQNGYTHRHPSALSRHPETMHFSTTMPLYV